MDTVIVVVENNIPDEENQLEKVKSFFDYSISRNENKDQIRERCYSIVQASYSILSKVPIQQIKPVVFKVFTSTYNKLLQIVN